MDALPPRSSWRVGKITRWPQRPSTGGLLEEGVEAIPVRVVIEQEGFVTGWDDGAIGFDEDALWFSGQACSFRIFARNLLVRKQEGLFAVETRLSTQLRHPSRSVALSVEIVPMEERREWEDEERVAVEIARLVERDDGLGTSQYPPLTLQPGVRPMDAVEWQAALMRATWWSWPFSFGRSLSILTNSSRLRLLHSIAGDARSLGDGSPTTGDPQ